MGTKTKQKECKCIWAALAILSWFIFLIVCILPYLDYISYTKSECIVTHIDYPTELPNNTNQEFWTDCKCGRSCHTLTPCITIYGFVNNNNTIYKFKDSPNNKHLDCTFQEQKCPEGENIVDRQNVLIAAKNTFEEYNNKTVSCYLEHSKNLVVLNNDYNYNYLIAFSVISIIMTCICSCYICCV